MKYKIAILYICTGKYDIFWSDFYRSSEQFFFKNHNKHYFVFTDSNKIKSLDNISVIQKKTKGFPADSLSRFDMFLEIEDTVSSYDYTFFLNSNMIFLRPLSVEIFPHENFKGIIGVTHPMGYIYADRPAMFTYERNKKSTAYIPKIKGKVYNYYMGGFNGGSVAEFYKMAKELSNNICEDKRNGIVAVYHDESHLNKYFSDNEVHSLSTSYGYPEGWDLPLEPIVMIRDKTRYDDFFNKKAGFTWFKFKFEKLTQFYKALTW
jgi:hypothetical protein